MIASVATRRRWRWVIGFCNRLAYASLVGVYVWLGTIEPSLWSVAVLRLLTRMLDLPVALAGLLLPMNTAFIDLFFNRGIREWAFVSPLRVLLWHLQVSVPVYLVLFYLPALIGRTLRRHHPSAVVERKGNGVLKELDESN